MPDVTETQSVMRWPLGFTPRTLLLVLGLGGWLFGLFTGNSATLLSGTFMVSGAVALMTWLEINNGEP